MSCYLLFKEPMKYLVPRGSGRPGVISVFPKAEPTETLRFERNKINCFPRDQSLSDLLYSQRRHLDNADEVGQPSFAANSALLLSDVIDFAMLPAQRYWMEVLLKVSSMANIWIGHRAKC